MKVTQVSMEKVVFEMNPKLLVTLALGSGILGYYYLQRKFLQPTSSSVTLIPSKQQLQKPTYVLPPQKGIATLLAHGDSAISDGPDLAPPIHLATTYESNNSQNMVYARQHNLTRMRVERVLGQLEGGYALVYSSGLAAITAVVFHYKPKNIWINEGYLGSLDVFGEYLKLVYGPLSWFEHIKKFNANSVFENGDLIWLETPKNPSLDIEDISYYAEKAHAVSAIVAVDSTFATPILQKPLDLGADVVIHSATKFMAGHSDVLAGVVITRQALGSFTAERSHSGGSLGNLEAYLLLRSLRTLELRVTRQSENATKLAHLLESSPYVFKVNHPSLPNNPYHELAKKQMKGFPGILSFLLHSEAEVHTFLKHLKLVTDATSLGGYHTTIYHTYGHFDTSVDPRLLRLSVEIIKIIILR